MLGELAGRLAGSARAWQAARNAARADGLLRAAIALPARVEQLARELHDLELLDERGGSAHATATTVALKAALGERVGPGERWQQLVAGTADASLGSALVALATR